MLAHPFGKPLGTAFVEEEGIVGLPADEGNDGHGNIAKHGDFLAAEHPPGAKKGEFNELISIRFHSKAPLFLR